MLCSLPTPALRIHNAELALLSTTSRSCDNNDSLPSNSSTSSLQYGQGESVATFWPDLEEQSALSARNKLPEKEPPWRSEDSFRASVVEIQDKLLTDMSHCRSMEDKEVEQLEVMITSESNLRPFGSGTDQSLGTFLKACSDQKDLRRGTNVHSEIIKLGLFESNVFLGTGLVNFYAKCGALEIAERVFNELPVRSIVSWNALIGGYARHLHTDKALSCYSLLKQQGFIPNTATFLSILKSFGSKGLSEVGQIIHAQIVKSGLLDDTRISTALLDMYAKSGALVTASRVFNNLIIKDVIAWTALILAYASHDCGEEALQCYEEMQLEGLAPDAFTSACILKACGSLGIVYEGQKIHAEFVSSKTVEQDMVAGSALVDMYANCGMLAEAQEVFNSLPIKNVVAWSALMEGYAQLGKDKIVFGLFDRMVRSGSNPTWVTFTILLNACTHEGLSVQGMVYFQKLSEDYSIIPKVEHYTCMADLYCRAGQLDKVMAMVDEMSVSANLVFWKTLLDACQKWGNTTLGSWAFNNVVELDKRDAAAYVSVSQFSY